MLTAGSAQFLYDPNGRLFQYVANGNVRQFVYDGDALIGDYLNGSLENRFVHGDQVDEPWVRFRGSKITDDVKFYLHSNHQGSIIAESSQTGSGSGSVTSTLAYDAFGIAGQNNVGVFGYTGQMYLKELGLYYYKARIYSPKLGRFLQTDPIGYKDDMNLYAYVGNDPVNQLDPKGERKWGLSFGGGVAAIGGFKFGFDINYDTTHKEMNISGTGGLKAGYELTAKAELYTEPSADQTKGTQVAVEGKLKAEAKGEIKTPIGNASANAEASAAADINTKGEFSTSTEKKVSDGAAWGPVSVDTNGKASIGGGVGASVTTQASVNITMSAKNYSDKTCK